jgi:hypothetical protein
MNNLLSYQQSGTTDKLTSEQIRPRDLVESMMATMLELCKRVKARQVPQLAKLLSKGKEWRGCGCRYGVVRLVLRVKRPRSIPMPERSGVTKTCGRATRVTPVNA